MSSEQDHTANRVVLELPTLSMPPCIQKVVGKRSPLTDDLEEFRGIPYGKVTKRWEHASLRYRLPLDVLDATKDGPICPQPKTARHSEYYQSYLEFPDLDQSEFDCLNLLIIRPSPAALSRAGIDPSSKLPVLVYIHGGAGTGAGSDPVHDPSRLVLRSLEIGTPIIAVNLNFRIGVFGLLGSTDILKAQDQTNTNKGLNFGLHDQKVGLLWVARNITHFGGDPERIAVLGGSTGGSALYAHILDADASDDLPLFQKAILKSPPMLTILPSPLAEADANWDKLSSYPTTQAAIQILDAYGITDSSDQKALQEALERFHSDAVFDLGIFRARNRLRTQRRREYGDTASIQSYHVEYGNPFLGARQGLSHHAVDGIYMFDAFHDALADADNGIFRSYAESRADSAHPSKSATESPAEKPTASSRDAAFSHLELAQKFQEYIIGFILGMDTQKVAEDEVLVWNKTGSVRVERWAESSKWKERMNRLRLLEQDTASILRTLATI
ncbi:Para-nitrobenzyl esterase [Fusarium odoratissimum]|uniref:Carboxylic ester hydrolase n=1 Tax=Fusarium oxysporum f. sp. cubense (strain race 4) TaxID=2502994 RepID=N1SC59_FUSC4|nr:Para-nitrobenzyl esterase [Fusarium odoratissimum]